MAVTALVAVMLYVLVLRPPAVARGFAREMSIAATTDLSSVSKRYFQDMRTDSALLEVALSGRSWSDILRCRQRFQMRMMRPSDKKNQWVAAERDFYASPVGVTDLGRPVLVTIQRSTGDGQTRVVD
jgi:hypothetical protein